MTDQATDTSPLATGATEQAAPASAPQEQAPAPAPSWETRIPAKYHVDGKPDMARFVDGYEHLNKLMGDRNIPTDPDGYKFAETFKVDADTDKALRGWAHSTGMTQKQLDAAMQYLPSVAESMAKQMMPDAQAVLSQEWGDQFGAQVDRAKAEFGRIGKEAGITEAAGTNPDVVRLLAYYAAQRGEDKPAQAAMPAGFNVKEAYARLLNMAPQHPEYATLNAQVNAYYKGLR